MEAAHPELSIVVAAYRAEATIERCLDALTRQETATIVEIVVVDSGDDATARIVAGGYPQVRLLRSPTRLDPGAARNAGVAAARADLLGFVDADCVAAPDWAARVLDAHRRGVAAVAGTVANGDRSAVGWAQFFCEFHRWMPGARAGAIADAPTCCFAVERALLARFGPFRDTGYCSDTAFCWRLGGAGRPPVLDPTIRVTHVDRTTLARFARKQWRHGRAFATMRVSEQRLSGRARAAFVAGAPVLPALLAWRLWRSVALEKRRDRGRLLASAPLVLAGLVLWSLGELAGYARPTGRAAPGASTRPPESKNHASATTSV